MRVYDMKQFVVGDKVAKLPIVQGGMGIGVSLERLASAVANEGGIGVISAAGVGMFDGNTRDFQTKDINVLREKIQKAREMTSGLLGVNIMVALTDFDALAKAAIEEEIDFIFAGAGLPLNLPKYLNEESSTKLVPIISSGRAAKILTKKWIQNYDYIPDAFVLEGPKAGGHLGFKRKYIENEDYKLENLLPEVLDALAPFEEEYGRKIPVIVGGGIFDGEDIFYFLNHGASAVQMATRFVATEECDASLEFKQTYINAKENDIIYINSPVGLVGRAIKNDFLVDVEKGLKHPFVCPYNCIKTCKKEEAPYCISIALINAKLGKFKNGFAFAGSNAYKIDKIIPVKELFQKLIQEYHKAFQKLNLKLT